MNAAAPVFCPTEPPEPPPPPRAPLLALPPAMWTRSRSVFSSPIFRRWIVLSILLHALAILLFGAPTGGSREGRAMWGKLSVVIKEGWRDTGPDLKLERQLAPVPGPATRQPPREATPRAPVAPPAPAPQTESRPAPAAEKPPAEAPKVETPKVEAPKAEVPKVEPAPVP
ncbi:MAG TPA: hypothetical protein VEA38_05080, partial [Terriglobales bacterium]|nr:hypothetical protein [Terriglobales bacterium]